jgi:hypothetical protein
MVNHEDSLGKLVVDASERKLRLSGNLFDGGRKESVSEDYCQVQLIVFGVIFLCFVFSPSSVTLWRAW